MHPSDEMPVDECAEVVMSKLDGTRARSVDLIGQKVGGKAESVLIILLEYARVLGERRRTVCHCGRLNIPC